MKKLILSATLVLASASAYADSQTGSLYLAGEIPVVTTIEVKAEPNVESLDLLHDARDLKVASVSERNNTWQGYVVTLKSKKAGHFGLETGGIIGAVTNNIRYSAKYGGRSVDLSLFPQVIYSSSRINLFAQKRDLNLTISYEGQDASDKLAGKYSDTLTMTISAR